MPVGANIPLVLQVGKWRRELVIPQVSACHANDLDAALGKDKLRLPKNGSEGDMPLIAFTSGCDPAECFLRHIGIDDAEFAPPGTAGKHVHFYTGWYYAFTGYPYYSTAPASSVAGGNTPADTYAWWTDAQNLLHYDIVFDACECHPFDRGAAAYPAIDAYLNGGGRVFATHFFYNWFAPQTGTPDLQSVAAWNPVVVSPTPSEVDAIDTTLPKGQMFAKWLQNIGVASGSGQLTLADTDIDITSPAPAGCTGASCLSTRWIYEPTSGHPRFISFNTPVSQPAGNQCGRAVFSDVHLSGSSNAQTFPAECSNPDPGGAHAVNERALEFLFFDLSTCVQNDTQPPMQPPAQ